MKKKSVILFFLNFLLFIYPETLPQPKNDQLYTEFTAKRTSTYLKKPVTGNGYIVMNGKNNFLFRQNTPVLIDVRKKGESLTLKINNNDPIEISSGSDNDNIAFLFDNPINLEKNYYISKTVSAGLDEFLVVPKKASKIEKIILTATGDMIRTLNVYFRDKTVVNYEFRNTKTGTIPDEKLF
jgi:outer membrane lipoprotein-sorting protein